MTTDVHSEERRLRCTAHVSPACEFVRAACSGGAGGSPAARWGAALHTVPVAQRCAAEREQLAGLPRPQAPAKSSVLANSLIRLDPCLCPCSMSDDPSPSEAAHCALCAYVFIYGSIRPYERSVVGRADPLRHHAGG